jgi:nitroimidazol reductase NimA-like FMN-containing flavoprotein (pyridoxamine 5'-phosphate oxidase superfamily)
MNEAASFPISNRNKVRRVPDRGRFDKATVYDIMDSALVAHIAYTIDGQPYCTPASRMIRSQSAGVPVCVTVTHMDAIVLARSGFHHSVNYRSVMAFGTARLVTDAEEKRRALNGFVDRFFPGRSKEIRPANGQEFKATSFIVMPIDEASGKIRSTHVKDDEEDYALPVWTALIPVTQVLGEPDLCERSIPGLPVPEGMKGYTAGRRLDETLLEAYRKTYPE